MPNCAPTQKQVMNATTSIFINAIPVTMWIGSALSVRRYAMMDMIWNILDTGIWNIWSMEPFVNVERQEMNHAMH